jgi:8-oxo-dGTP pyrophosphatase MutT (NUDIX family)
VCSSDLLQKRTDTNDWGTIGGALELGESFEEAARRELYEEAGLTTKQLHFKTILSGKDMYFKYPHGDEVYNALTVYEAEGIEGTPKINDDEGLELRYFSLDKPITELNVMARKILEKSGYINTI